MPSLESEQISISTVTIKQQNKHLSTSFSVITMVSEVSYSHSSPFHGSADIIAVDRHGLLTNVSLHGGVETPRHYYCFWLCSTSTNALFSYITYKNSVFAVLYVETSILFFSRTNSHLYGSKQPRRRDLSNGTITPHSAHVLVQQSFLKEGAVVETKRYAFA